MKVDNVCVSYGDKNVISDLCAEIKESQITVIIGPNGCGKSTLLKTMTRVLSPNQGAVYLDGKELSSLPTKEVAKKLAFLPQSQGIVSGLTVFELVSYGRYPYQKGLGKLTKHDLEMIEWSMDVTSTLAIKDRRVDALSGGQRQRVWIAMALAQETDMIFLDEPTTYLDVAHQLDLLHLLKRLNKEAKKTIVMVLHDINQAAYFSDYIIAMKDGKIIKTGNEHEVVNKTTMREVFSVDVDIMMDKETNKPITFNYKRI